MDRERLIELVRAREELYDIRHPNHRNRELVAAIWKEIGAQLNTTDVDAKNKWQILRSNYMRERRKVKAAILGYDGGSSDITWPFFSRMTFLEGSLEMRKSRGSFPEDSEETPLEAVDLEETASGHYCPVTPQESESSCDNFGGPWKPTVLAPVSNGACAPQSRKRKPTPDVEGQNSVQQLEWPPTATDSNDPDILFFRGLLPQIRRLDSTSNLSFKVEVAQLLLRKLQSQSSFPQEKCQSASGQRNQLSNEQGMNRSSSSIQAIYCKQERQFDGD